MTLAQFKLRVTPLDGQTMYTTSRRRPFALRVLPDGMAITPSTGKERFVSWPMMDSILERFRELRSFTPVRYRDLTFDSSYVMAILKRLSTT
jgi:hypothetical protein